MTPLRKSTHSNRIVKDGYQPARPGSSKPNQERCPIIGDPLKWLEDYNKQCKPDAK